ncbi:MAG: metallophosphoesterase family protein [Leptospirillia bacterium]
MKFLHAADIHLDSPLRNLALSDPEAIARIRRASREAFSQLVDLALSERVSFLLLAGDLYDHDTPNMQIALFLRRELSRLADAGISVALVLGNHDAGNRMTSLLDLPGNTRIFSSRAPETLLLKECGVAVTGQSLRDGPVNDNLAREFPSPRKGYFNIALLHTSLGGSPDHDVYAPCTLADLAARDYDYWALGHIHKGEIVSRDPYVVYPGNLQGRHARETGPKGAVLVEVRDGKVVSCDLVPLDVVRWHRVDVDLDGSESLREAGDRVRSRLAETLRQSGERPAVVRVTLFGQTALASGPLESSRALRDLVDEAAGELLSGEIWIEKVVGRILPPPGEDPAKERGGGEEFFSIVAELMGDETALETLVAADLEELRGRLPESLRSRLSPGAPETLFPDRGEIFAALRTLLSREETS